MEAIGRCHFPLGFFALLALASCSYAPAVGPYQSCDESGGCPAGCRCVADWICASGGLDRPPWECGPPTVQGCTGDEACASGCTCFGGACLGPMGSDCVDGFLPTCTDADLLVDTDVDEADGGPGNREPNVAMGGAGLSLREALVLAANTPGTHHISFGLPAGSRLLSLAEDLPDLPDRTHLDGAGQGVILRGAGAQVGLRVSGHGVVISGLALEGFSEAGIEIGRSAEEVHMYGLRVGHPDHPNGVGIDLLPDSRSVVLGRGRELACVPVQIAARQSDPASWDLNMVIGNTGDGIRARQVNDLSIYGTWVGFSPQAGIPDATSGNGGMGIRLEDVNGAVLGAQAYDAEVAQAMAGQSVDLGPAYVSVGRNQLGGVLVAGGGPVEMPGLYIGNTPVLYIYQQNEAFGLRVTGNEQPVSFGVGPWRTDYDALLHGLVFTSGSTGIEIDDNRAEVEVTGVQVVGLQQGPAVAMTVVRNQAPVRLTHLSFTLNVSEAALRLSDPGATVTVLNCLFRAYFHLAAPVFDGPGLESGYLDARSNMGFNFRIWSDGTAPDPSSNYGPADDPLDPVWADNARLIDPGSPAVDAGLDLGLDRNGPNPALFDGCGVDIGAFECGSEACLSVPCD